MNDGILSKPGMKKRDYYIVQWTWGIIMNLIGGCVYLYALFRKWPVEKYRNAIMIKAPKSFGGVNFGMFFVVGKNNEHCAAHEYGHSLQNLHWGLAMPFVIAIPSAVRYWYRKIKYTNKGLKPPTDYDSVWFEAQATEYGERATNNEWDWL